MICDIVPQITQLRIMTIRPAPVTASFFRRISLDNERLFPKDFPERKILPVLPSFLAPLSPPYP
jgi:hypothetical protein